MSNHRTIDGESAGLDSDSVSKAVGSMRTIGDSVWGWVSRWSDIRVVLGENCT
ncbi:hypothetical protein LC1Hm_1262 [Halomicrobium sp. LC1Hm]|nr:hypothetical protein LC1Hm_1262 [Halomicrobium sp. LC1Hm]